MRSSFAVVLIALATTTAPPAETHAQSSTAAALSMQERIGRAWTEIGRYAHPTQADSAQRAMADEFYTYYRRHPDTEAGQDALLAALRMWGNTGAAGRVGWAAIRIDGDSELWGHRMLIHIGNAYGRSNRWNDYIVLLHQLEARLTTPVGRSALLLRLGEHYQQTDRRRARRYYRAVVALGANPSDVKRAQGNLPE